MLNTALVIITAIAILLARQLYFSTYHQQLYLDIVFFLIVPIVVSLVLRSNITSLGLRIGKTKENLCFVTLALLVSIPLLFVAAQQPVFYNYYPIFGWARNSPAEFSAYELIIFIMMFSTEFFFRGFLLFGTKELGANTANFLQLFPYVVMHAGKPAMEIPASLVGGFFFGWIDLKSDSIIPSLLTHWCINIIFDAFCIYFSSRI